MVTLYEVHWISKGKVLQCFLPPLEEIIGFLIDKKDNQRVILKMQVGCMILPS